MDLHQLTAFRTVARLGTFSRAAAQLNLTQPAVSKQVQTLEDELGHRLFDRLGKTVRLTHAGEILAQYADEIAHLVAAAQAALADLHDLRRGHLTLGAAASLAMYVLPPLLEAYHQRYPQVHLTLEAKWSTEVMQKVAQHNLDLGLVLLVATVQDCPAELLALPFDETDLLFIAPPASPLVRQKRVPIQALKGVPWVLNEQSCGFRAYLERRFADAGVPLQVGVEVTGFEAHKKLVQAGLGVSVAPKLAILQELKAGTLKTFEIEGLTLTSVSCVVYRKDKYIHAAMRHFLDLLADAFPRLKHQKAG
jgi:DNA-binding transcriptional LysR family regulator